MTDSSLEGVFSGLLLSFLEKDRDRKDHFFLSFFFFFSAESAAPSGLVGVSGVSPLATLSADFSGVFSSAVLSTPLASFSVSSLTTSLASYNTETGGGQGGSGARGSTGWAAGSRVQDAGRCLWACD